MVPRPKPLTARRTANSSVGHEKLAWKPPGPCCHASESKDEEKAFFAAEINRLKSEGGDIAACERNWADRNPNA